MKKTDFEKYDLNNHSDVWKLVRGSHEIRRTLTAEQKKLVSSAYNLNTLNSENLGKYGCVFEGVLREKLVKNSAVIGCQKRGKKDIQLSLGDRVLNIEAKTGAGKIYEGYELLNATDFNESFLNFDYIAYNPFYKEECDVYDTYFFTPKAWLKFMNESYVTKKGEPKSLLSFKNVNGAIWVYIMEFRNSNAKLSFFENIAWTVDDIEGAYSYDEFMELIGKE